jgi:hypothetical protein
MVEYTVVLSLGCLTLLGPGSDVIRWTMRSISDNFQGYSYAMSLSEWPEFPVPYQGPIAGGGPMVTAAAPGMARTGRPGTLPARAPQPDSLPDDWAFWSYVYWLEDPPRNFSDERIVELSGQGADQAVTFLEQFTGGDRFSLEPPDAGDLLPDFDDLIDDLIADILPF